MKTFLAASLAFVCAVAAAQPATPPSAPAPVRLRGAVETFDGTTLVVKGRTGEVVTLALADNFSVVEVVPIELGSIQAGSYIGTAAMPNADGSALGALAITVFPEASRGVGEGHGPWDLQPGSTMTNGTVAAVASVPQGRTLTLRYKDSEKTINVAEGTPIVTFRPSDRSLLVPGARVTVTTQLRDGRAIALRAQVGRNGVAPPS